MNNCPCCSQTMLRHIRHQNVYWFCRNCWSEMPLLEKKLAHFGLSSAKNEKSARWNNPSLNLA